MRYAISPWLLALVAGLGLVFPARLAADTPPQPKFKDTWQVWVTKDGKTQFYSQTPKKAEAQKTAETFNQFPGGKIKGEVRGPIKVQIDAAGAQILITVPGNEMVYRISADGKMPTIQADATIQGSTTDVSGVSFTWTAQVRFTGNETRHGRAGTPLDASKTAPGGHFVINPGDWGNVRGGKVTLVAKATIDGKTATGRLEGLTILGTNPSLDDVRAALGNDALRRIAHQESNFRQFGDDGYPLFSADNLGGAGIMQITPASEDQRWDWKANVKAGVAKYQQTYRLAATYVQSMRNSTEFSDLVAAINKDRKANKLAALTVTIPDFTEEQRTNDAIRGYNGWAGQDPIVPGLHLHEYRLARDGNGRLRLRMIPGANRAEAIWERVSAADRPQGTGDPDYVNHVLAQTP